MGRNNRSVSDSENSLRDRISELEEQLLRKKSAKSGSENDELNFRQIAETSRDALFVCVNDKVVFANAAVARLIGAESAEQLLGTPALNIVHPDSHENFKQLWSNSAGGAPDSEFHTIDYATLDGSAIEVEAAATRIKWDGEAGLCIVAHEATERRFSREGPRESEARFRSLIEGSPLAIQIMSAQSKRLYINQAFLDLLGYATKEEIYEMVAPAPFVAPHHREMLQQIRTAREKGKPAPTTYDFDVCRKDGTIVSVQVVTRSVIWDGKPAQLRTYIDLTDRKLAENALRESEQRYRMLFDTSPDAMLITGRNGIIVFTNATASKMFAEDDTRKLIGMDMMDLVHDDEKDEVEARRQKILAGSYAPFAERKRNRLDGSGFHTESRGVPFTWNGDPAVLIVIRDITERKMIEEQLRQAQKMEVVGQLTGGIAHDFNNLLTIIQGNTELIAHETGGDDKSVQQILRATRRGGEMTHRLLAFARQQPLRPQIIDLASLIDGLSDLLTRALGEGIEAEFDLEAGVWPVMADPGQLESALLNLAINARDAMPGGGKLTIGCSNAQLTGDEWADGREFLAGEYVVVAVSDTGTGMSAEIQARVFEPFFTTKEVGGGSGLGLSMVYGFVNQSGGLVSIYSEEGLGTTVKLYLPRGDTRNPQEKTDVGDAVPRGEGELILVIEDDDDVRDLTEKMLIGLGYRVAAVPTANDALNALAAGKEVELVLSDVVLRGGVSGPDFAEKILQSHPRLPIIFMSGYPAVAERHAGFLDSGAPFINKPFERRQLAQILRDALA